MAGKLDVIIFRSCSFCSVSATICKQQLSNKDSDDAHKQDRLKSLNEWILIFTLRVDHELRDLILVQRNLQTVMAQ